MLSVPHLIILFIVVLVVFGPHKLPELARSLGKLMAEFRKASTDFRYAFEEEMRNIERQARETEFKKAQAAAAASTPALPASQGTAPEPATEGVVGVEPVADIEPTIRRDENAVPRSATPSANGQASEEGVSPESNTSQEHEQEAVEKPLHDHK